MAIGRRERGSGGVDRARASGEARGNERRAASHRGGGGERVANTCRSAEGCGRVRVQPATRRWAAWQWQLPSIATRLPHGHLPSLRVQPALVEAIRAQQEATLRWLEGSSGERSGRRAVKSGDGTPATATATPASRVRQLAEAQLLLFSPETVARSTIACAMSGTMVSTLLSTPTLLPWPLPVHLPCRPASLAPCRPAPLHLSRPI